MAQRQLSLDRAPDDDIQVLFHVGCMLNDEAVIKQTLDRGACPDRDFIFEGSEDVPLFCVCRRENVAAIKLLLEHGCQVNKLDKDKNSALHYSCHQNRMEVTTLLLDYGADANIISPSGFTPLHLACKEGHTRMAELLIGRGAYVDRKALKEAQKHSRQDVVKLLSDHMRTTSLTVKLRSANRYP